MDDVEILRITHHPDRKPPLRVAFRADGDTREIDATAAQIQSFAAFQRLVATRLGLWLTFWSDARPRRAAAEWQEMVARAFAAGRGGQ